jgi:predicted lipoprotein with Yx(FWY)xxD motif
MKTPSAAAIAVLGASALLAAGCGSSKSPNASSTSSASSSAAQSGAGATGSGATGSGAAGSSAAGSSSAAGTIVTVKHAGKLGTILAAGPERMTVYLFEADKGPSSKCSGACAGAWPPVTTSGAPVIAGGAVAADLGTIKRQDGTTQITYKGHPLYYFVKDKDSGDAYGQGVNGFGASWYVLSAQGAKVDNS